MARAPLKPKVDDERVTDIDAQVDQPSITISVETTAPGLSREALSPVSSLSPALGSPAAPADDDDMQTLQAESRATGARSVGRSPNDEGVGPTGAADMSLSLITPRLEPIGLVRAERAIANGPDAAEIRAMIEGAGTASSLAQAAALSTVPVIPADDDPDTSETGTTRRQKPPDELIGTIAKQSSRRVVDDLATTDADGDDDDDTDHTLRHKEEPTLDPTPAALASPLAAPAPNVVIPDPSPSSRRGNRSNEEDETMPKAEVRRVGPSSASNRALSPQEAVVSAFANLADLPPIRPRLDSEAAGHWPPWHSQSDEARSLLGALPSPVSSGTEAIPRAVVQEAIASVRPDASAKAKLERAATMLQVQPAGPLPSSAPHPAAPSHPPPHFIATPAGPSFPPPVFRETHPMQTPQPHMAPMRPPIDSTSTSSDVSAPPTSSAQKSNRPKKRGMTPFGAFLVAFFVFGALFGGAAAVRRYGWPAFVTSLIGKSSSVTATTATTPTPSAPSASASPAASDSAAAPPASASAPAPASASASASPPASGSASAHKPPRHTRPPRRTH